MPTTRKIETLARVVEDMGWAQLHKLSRFVPAAGSRSSSEAYQITRIPPPTNPIWAGDLNRATFEGSGPHDVLTLLHSDQCDDPRATAGPQGMALIQRM